MDKLNTDLYSLAKKIEDLEVEIEKAKKEAEDNVKPLKEELLQVKKDKSQYAYKGDFDSVEECRRREENLKFKITAQWNECSILKNDLAKLKIEKRELEDKIKLERDRIKRACELSDLMDKVLDNYKKSQSLKSAAIDSNISPDSVMQWYEWGKNDFSEIYTHFYRKISEIDEEFKNQEVQKLKSEMDRVIEAYRECKSLKKASQITGVSYDTVQYWHKWGSMGFGEENVYFFKNLDS